MYHWINFLIANSFLINAIAQSSDESLYSPHFPANNVMRYYDKINFHNFSSYQDFQNEFLMLVDDNLVASTNLIVGISTPECVHLFDSPAFKASQRYAGGDALTSVFLPASEFPIAAEGCAEVLFYPADTRITEPRAGTTDLNHRPLTQFIQEQIKTSITFTNNFPFKVELWWNDESKDSSFIGPIESGATYNIQSFLGHTFSAHEPSTTKGEPGRVLDFMVIQRPQYEFNAQNRLHTCESYDPDSLFVPITCDDMEKRHEQFNNYVWHQKRLGLNYVQPKFVPSVTEEGFLLRQLPIDTYKWLKQWYDEEQLRIGATEGSAGPCMNQAVAPSVITHLTSNYKDRLARELKPILHDWYGTHKGDIKLTSIYGIRKYINGSVLRMHVDTVNTHVVSAIINVDQEVTKDWPLLILDHDGNEHNVIMKPGDMVLYESAKLLHGRPEPFEGTHYDNIFIHYCPESGWDYSWV